jgi:hypothetical protein
MTRRSGWLARGPAGDWWGAGTGGGGGSRRAVGSAGSAGSAAAAVDAAAAMGPTSRAPRRGCGPAQGRGSNARLVRVPEEGHDFLALGPERPSPAVLGRSASPPAWMMLDQSASPRRVVTRARPSPPVAHGRRADRPSRRLTTGQTRAGNGRPVAHHPSRQGPPLSLRLAIRGPGPGPCLQLGPHARALPGTAAGACRARPTRLTSPCDHHTGPLRSPTVTVYGPLDLAPSGRVHAITTRPQRQSTAPCPYIPALELGKA